MTRNELIAPIFVELADTLVEGYDLIDFLILLTERCVELLDVSAAGVALADRNGSLRVMASSSEEMRLLELIELQSSEGPCYDCWTDRRDAVRADDLARETGRWPTFAPAAQEAGFRSAYALPLRLRTDRIGALNLFAKTPTGLSAEDQAVGQAMADIATIGILNQRTISRQTDLAEQLQTALDSRVLLEQSKGMVAEQGTVSSDEAFVLIRAYARSRQRGLHEVARSIIAREITAVDLHVGRGAAPGPSA